MVTKLSGYGISEALAAGVEQLVLDVLRQDPTILQKKLSQSSDLAAALSNENGTGNVVFDNGANLINPKLKSSTTAAQMGNVTLVAGSSGAISLTNASAASFVQLQRKTIGGTIGELTYSLGAGTLTITSASATDTSIVTYLLLNGY